MSAATISKTEREKNREYLTSPDSYNIQPGEKVYTILKHVSQSGMYRVVDLYVIHDNRPIRITYSACAATGMKYDRRHEGMGVGGCGTDVGFEAVYNLSIALFCNGTYDHDAAYSLKQEWL